MIKTEKRIVKSFSVLLLTAALLAGMVAVFPSATTQAAAKKSIKKAKVTVTKSVTYTGKKVTPKVTVKYGKKKLKKNRDYTVKYRNNKKVGKALVVVKGKGKYKGTVKKTFQIVPKVTANKSGTKTSAPKNGASSGSTSKPETASLPGSGNGSAEQGSSHEHVWQYHYEETYVPEQWSEPADYVITGHYEYHCVCDCGQFLDWMTMQEVDRHMDECGSGGHRSGTVWVPEEPVTVHVDPYLIEAAHYVCHSYYICACGAKQNEVTYKVLD